MRAPRFHVRFLLVLPALVALALATLRDAKVLLWTAVLFFIAIPTCQYVSCLISYRRQCSLARRAAEMRADQEPEAR
jgi:hypothetical protein